jgi:type II secretory pathway pseudopilin PulG
LVEVVLALGVISFAIVGIMGLFPVAMKSAQESQRETRATLAAQQIFADMRTAAGSNRFVISGPSAANTNAISLAANTNLYLAFGTNGVPITSISSADFTNSYTAADAIFLADIAVDTNTGVPNLSRVQVTVAAPAAAPSAARSKYHFVTLMNY